MTRVGMCPECGETIALHERAERLVGHQRQTVWGHTTVIVNGQRVSQSLNQFKPCPGSGKNSVAQREENRNKRRAKERQRIDRYRKDASVVLDAVLEGRDDFAGSLWAYRNAALSEHRLLFPKSRATVPWVFAVRTTSARRTSRADENKTGDVYCLFCGELVLTAFHRSSLKWLRDQTVENAGTDRRRIERHTTPCALQCLAGMREYAAPGTRKLPADAVGEEAVG